MGRYPRPDEGDSLKEWQNRGVMGRLAWYIPATSIFDGGLEACIGPTSHCLRPHFVVVVEFGLEVCWESTGNVGTRLSIKKPLASYKVLSRNPIYWGLRTRVS